MRSTYNLPPLTNLKKFMFFLKKTHLSFQRKSKFCRFWEIQFQLHFPANLLQIGDKKFSRSEPSFSDTKIRRTFLIGKLAQIKHGFEWMISFHILNMAGKQQEGRLPPELFLPFNFVKEDF